MSVRQSFKRHEKTGFSIDAQVENMSSTANTLHLAKVWFASGATMLCSSFMATKSRVAAVRSQNAAFLVHWGYT